MQCTEGVDLSTKFMELSDFSALDGCPRLQCLHKVDIGFVDTEGQGGRNPAYDTALMCPILLTAKVVLFNWKGPVDRDTILNKLGVVAWVAQRVKNNNKTAPSLQGAFCRWAIVNHAC
jgi:hypothetical protein